MNVPLRCQNRDNKHRRRRTHKKLVLINNFFLSF